VIDAVVTHHVNPFTSGVARFNQLLAEHLRVPLLPLLDERIGDRNAPLFSFKVSELANDERLLLTQRLDALSGKELSVFLHEWCGLELEERLCLQANRVLCGNGEVAKHAAGISSETAVVWAPGLLLDCRPFEPAHISVFSFGMAHKVRTDMFRRLRELLERSCESYAVYVSNANHETASIREAQLVYEQMEEIFHRGLYFMGNLSDVAVYNYLCSTTYFAAFFRGGVRANNTSVASAMEHGAVVLTNLDEHSPPYLRHMDNVIDIEACDALPSDPLVLRRISVRAMETARERSWDRLVEHIRNVAAPAKRNVPAAGERR
jgi:hypothetical protein